MPLDLDYYYGNEAEQYSFYRIPKVLFTDRRFKDVSVEAKVLYGLLRDRMSLSVRNGWMDGDGRVYIIFTIVDVMEALVCAEQKANKLLNELDTTKGVGLIERKRRGLGKPNVISVKNFITRPPGVPGGVDVPESSEMPELSGGHGVLRQTASGEPPAPSRLAGARDPVPQKQPAVPAQKMQQEPVEPAMAHGGSRNTPGSQIQNCENRV